MNGKCEWLQQSTIPIHDQQLLIFGEKRLLMKTINWFKQSDEHKWINQQGIFVDSALLNCLRIFSLESLLEDVSKPTTLSLLEIYNEFSSGLNKEDHMIIVQRLSDMEKRRVGTRFIDREATEEDQSKPLMQILAEKGITCTILWQSNKVEYGE